MFVSKMSFTIHYPDTATPAAGADTATPAAGAAAAAAGRRRRRPLSLVGLVGRDGQVYWVESFAAKLFHTETLTIHHVNPPLPTVSDVVGFIPIHLHRLHPTTGTQQPKRRCLSNRTHYFRNWLLKQHVLTHDQLCQAFHNYTTTTTTTAAAAAATAVNDDDDVEDRARIHHFGELLNNRETHVLEETDSRHQCHLRIVNININNNNNNNNRLENPPPRSPAELVAFFRDDIRSIPFFIWLAFFKLEIKKKLYQPSSSSPPPPSV